MEDRLQQLKDRMARISNLRRAAAVLRWDQETQMPPGGARQRADQVSTLEALAHELFTADEVGRLLDDLAPWAAEQPYDSIGASMVRVHKRDYDKLVRVPVAWVEEESRVTSLAHNTWIRAKGTNDFALFESDLARVIDLQRQWAGFFTPGDNIYDPLLDQFEPGLELGNHPPRVRGRQARAGEAGEGHRGGAAGRSTTAFCAARSTATGRSPSGRCCHRASVTITRAGASTSRRTLSPPALAATTCASPR